MALVHNSFIFLLLSTVILSGCSKGKSKPVVDVNLIEMPVQLKLKSPDALKNLNDSRLSTLTEAQQKVFDQIAKKGLVNYNDLTDAMIAVHVKDYAIEESLEVTITASTFNTQVSEALNALDKSLALEQLKPAYEGFIENKLGSKIIYDPDSYASPYLTNKGEMQCFSGTSFHQTMARKYYDRLDFDSKKFVIINEPGHVLPGYIENTEEGPVLFGIETTASGQGLMEYGLVNQYQGCAKLTDPHVYSVMLAFRDLIANPESLTSYSDKLINQNYKIDVARLEATCQQDMAQTQSGGHKLQSSSGKITKGWGTASSLPGPPIQVSRTQRPPIERSLKAGALLPQSSILNSGPPNFEEEGVAPFGPENFQENPFPASNSDAQNRWIKRQVDNSSNNEKIFSLYASVLDQESDYLNSKFQDYDEWSNQRKFIKSLAYKALQEITALERARINGAYLEYHYSNGKMHEKMDLAITEKKQKLSEIIDRYSFSKPEEQIIPEALRGLLKKFNLGHEPLSFRLPDGLKISFVPIETEKGQQRFDLIQVGFQTLRYKVETGGACENSLNGFYKIQTKEVQTGIFQLTLNGLDEKAFEDIKEQAFGNSNIFKSLNPSQISLNSSLQQIMEVEKVFPLILKVPELRNSIESKFKKNSFETRANKSNSSTANSLLAEEFQNNSSEVDSESALNIGKNGVPRKYIDSILKSAVLYSDKDKKAVFPESYYNFKCPDSKARNLQKSMGELLVRNLGSIDQYYKFTKDTEGLFSLLEKIEANLQTPQGPLSTLHMDLEENLVPYLKIIQNGLSKKASVFKTASETSSSGFNSKKLEFLNLSQSASQEWVQTCSAPLTRTQVKIASQIADQLEIYGKVLFEGSNGELSDMAPKIRPTNTTNHCEKMMLIYLSKETNSIFDFFNSALELSDVVQL